MNVNKASKVESRYAKKDPIGWFLGSFSASKASIQKKATPPEKNEVKPCLAHSSNNNFVNRISDGHKAIKSNISCKRVLCSTGTSKPSGSNTTRSWNASCTRLLCPFGGSKSKSLNPVAHSSRAATKEKSVEGSRKIKHDCKNESKVLVNRSSMASPKIGSLCKTNKERQSDPAGQSARLSKLPPVPVTRNPIHKTSSPKNPPIYNLRSKVQINDSPNDPPPNNLRSKVHKTQVSKDSPITTRKKEIQKTESPKAFSVPIKKREIPKLDGPKDSPIFIKKTETQKEKAQKRKFSEAPVKKTGTIKISSPSLADHDKNHPSSSGHEPYSCTPIYHIKWDGDDKKQEPSGQNCILCNKDFSYSPHSNNCEYGDDDEYEIVYRPQLLPAVDILTCGHAFHSECLRYATPEEQSSDAECVLCLSMA